MQENILRKRGCELNNKEYNMTSKLEEMNSQYQLLCTLIGDAQAKQKRFAEVQADCEAKALEILRQADVLAKEMQETKQMPVPSQEEVAAPKE